MKKIIRYLCIAVCTFTLFVSCSGNGEPLVFDGVEKADYLSIITQLVLVSRTTAAVVIFPLSVIPSGLSVAVPTGFLSQIIVVTVMVGFPSQPVPTPAVLLALQALLSPTAKASDHQRYSGRKSSSRRCFSEILPRHKASPLDRPWPSQWH